MKKSQKTQKRTKWLFIILILTAVLSITATYAWFSTQRDVDITGMRLNVEVAESMQISLDGEIWTQSIQIANMRQFYGTYTGTGDGFAIYQAKKPDNGGNLNYVPTELKPVSTVGTVTGGKLQFVKGTISTTAEGKTQLTDVVACSEADITATETIANRQNGNENHPYLVFDMYLRNVSAKSDDQVDILELNAGSNVWVNTGTSDDSDQEGAGVADTGLEYTARVGMIVYGNTVGITETDDADLSTGKTIGQKIRDIAADGGEVAAIWEPNDLEHTTYVVNNNGRGINSTNQAVVTYGVKETVATSEGKKVPNINDLEDTTNLAAVTTMKPAYTVGAGTDSKVNVTDTAGANVGLKPNTISKVRVYVWLEGQDPDCVDLASTGDKLSVTLKLTKEPTTGGEGNTYDDTAAPDPDPVP